VRVRGIIYGVSVDAQRTKSRRRVAVAVAVTMPLAVIATGVARADEPAARSIALDAAGGVL
jgi:hypothetical protein